MSGVNVSTAPALPVRFMYIQTFCYPTNLAFVLPCESSRQHMQGPVRWQRKQCQSSSTLIGLVCVWGLRHRCSCQHACSTSVFAAYPPWKATVVPISGRNSTAVPRTWGPCTVAVQSKSLPSAVCCFRVALNGHIARFHVVQVRNFVKPIVECTACMVCHYAGCFLPGRQPGLTVSYASSVGSDIYALFPLQHGGLELAAISVNCPETLM